MKRIKSPLKSLQNPATWAAFSVPLWTLATQLDKPFSMYCYAGATICSLIAVILKSPAEASLDYGVASKQKKKKVKS